MKIMRDLHNVWTQDDVAYLSQFGIIRIVKDNEPIKIEDGPLYRQLSDHFYKKPEHPLYSERFWYEYSREEVLASDYCVLLPMTCRGYPEPHEDYAYEDIYFDRTLRCKKCGQEKHQVDSYRISAVPRNPLWTYMAWESDVLFTNEEIYKKVFQPLGIECLKVNKKSGKTYEGVLQLVLPTTDEGLDMSLYKYNVCPVCGRKKYYGNRLPFAPLHDHPLPHIYLTKEYWGEGYEADRKIMVSIELAKKLIELKLIRYKYLIPCRSNYAAFLKTIGY